MFPKGKAGRAAAISVIAFGLIVGVRVVSAGSDSGDVKPFATVTEGTEPQRRTPETIPVVATPRAGVSCPSGSTSFDNTALHHTACIPAGWGFVDYEHAEPLTMLARPTLGSLHLFSAEAFPWQTGWTPLDAIDRRDAIGVDLLLVPAVPQTDTANPSGCVPAVGEAATSCDERLAADGWTPDVDGPLHVLKVSLPLLRAPVGLDATGERLLIIAKLSHARFEKEVTVLWRLVRTITPY
jgi:hypothetical protein